MNNSIKFLVDKKDDNVRLDIFLTNKISNITRSNLKKIIRSNKVKINKKLVNSTSKKVKIFDKITVDLEIRNSETNS